MIAAEETKGVFVRQIEEPKREKDIKLHLIILEEICDNVSSKVREQYEESPFPAWINLGLNPKPISISNLVDELTLKLQDYSIKEVGKPKILIAGCGTGQHSIAVASRFETSTLLAVDLSLSSLAYAKRKTEELGLENIEYMQADILNLGQLNKQFDIVESVGVLHHMGNPMEGWKVLTDCLKPGGLMKIGLYSELARKNNVKIKNEIKKLRIGSNDVEMKSYRDFIINSDKDHHEWIL